MTTTEMREELNRILRQPKSCNWESAIELLKYNLERLRRAEDRLCDFKDLADKGW